MKVQGKSIGKGHSQGRSVEVGRSLVCLQHSEEVGVVRAEEKEQQEAGWRDEGELCRCGKKIGLSLERDGNPLENLSDMI